MQFTNVGATMSLVAVDAAHKAVDAFVARGTAAPDAPAPLAAATSLPKPVAAVVPFAQPGTVDPSFDFATERLAKNLNDNGVTTVVLKPVDRLSVIARAPEICSTFGVNAIYVGAMRTEQTDLTKTHADVLVQNVDCKGTIVASADALGDNWHHGTNVRAGISAALDDALTHWTATSFPNSAAAKATAAASPAPVPSP